MAGHVLFLIPSLPSRRHAGASMGVCIRFLDSQYIYNAASHGGCAEPDLELEREPRTRYNHSKLHPKIHSETPRYRQQEKAKIRRKYFEELCIPCLDLLSCCSSGMGAVWRLLTDPPCGYGTPEMRIFSVTP